jgi:propanol-preferring alcohol dehydrogenase
MRAMVLTQAARGRLEPVERAALQPGPDDLVVRVHACGVCRTDLHVVDGELPDAPVPIVPGHEVVGRVEGVGTRVTGYSVGDRVGVPWLGWTCGECDHCRQGRENLCPRARFTGYQLDGGYADQMLVHADYALRLPDCYTDTAIAPLLCAGLIGYRAYRMAGSGQRLGLYGFGSAAHVLAQVARADGRELYAFTSPGDARAQAFARRLGAVWAGDSTAPPPVPLDAAIIFAPIGALVPEALARTAPGGVVVCAGIHMSDIPAFPYRLLWHERTVRSVANLTRDDGRVFLERAAATPIMTTVTCYPLSAANDALSDLREGRLEGTAVLTP